MITISTEGIKYTGKPTPDPVWQEVMNDNTMTLAQIKALYESRKAKPKRKERSQKVCPKLGNIPIKGG